MAGRRKTGLTASEYAVLGLLADAPDYGYRLQQQFSGETGLGLVCPVEPAALYAVLKSLSGLELIHGEWDRTQYPPKAVYSIAPEGSLTFERWLMSPVTRIREVRSEFLVKLYFAMKRDVHLARELLEAQRAVCDEYVEAVESHARGGGPYEAIVLGSKLTAARITREWLAEAIDQLRVADPVA